MTDDPVKAMPLLGDRLPEMTVKTTYVTKNLPGDYTGTMRWMVNHPQEAGRNVDAIPRSTRALQIASASEVAPPADRPNNALLGDRVIVPPAQTREDARRRPQECDSYDWWFCHKKLEE